MATLGIIVFVAYGCATQQAVPPPKTEVLQGIASWYGQEFAGRTTANGEIFDPLLLTAAHRTLPFGTVVDVRNPKTNETVRVRINDRGPYIGQRVIDLSYAAAQKISLIQPGSGTVDLTIVKVGAGDREPPAPYEVTAKEPTPKPQPKPAPQPTPARVASADPPPVEFPLPNEPKRVEEITVPMPAEPAVDTRRQVSADGRKVESVPVTPGAAPLPPASPGHSTAEALDRARAEAPPPAPVRKSGRFVVQVGAFSVEANAKALQERLTGIGQRAWIDREALYRVRLGPFASRDLALKARTELEANGISAIVMPE